MKIYQNFSKPSKMSSTNEQKDPSDLKNFLSEIQEMTTKNNKENIMTNEMQLDRLFSQKFQNPYDVLLLKPEAPEEEIKKQYRNVQIYSIFHYNL